MDNFGSFVGILIGVAVVFAVVAGIWKVFTKAGQPGWGCLIPIYNLVLLVKIAGKPGVWVLLMLIPFVNFVIAIMISIEIAKKFGSGTGFGLGLAFLPVVFYPILGFGDSRYLGPVQA